MADPIQVEQEQLANLQFKIYKIPFAVQDAIGLAQNAAQLIEIRLEELHARRVQELAQAETALATCRSTPPDKNGFKPSCYYQELAVERARLQVQIVEGTMRDVNRAVEQHHIAGQRMRDFAEGTLMEGKAKLAEKIKYLQQYRSAGSSPSRTSVTPSESPAQSMFGGGKESGPESREAGKESKEF